MSTDEGLGVETPSASAWTGVANNGPRFDVDGPPAGATAPSSNWWTACGLGVEEPTPPRADGAYFSSGTGVARTDDGRRGGTHAMASSLRSTFCFYCVVPRRLGIRLDGAGRDRPFANQGGRRAEKQPTLSGGSSSARAAAFIVVASSCFIVIVMVHHIT